MKLASQCGIHIPELRIVTIEDRDIFLCRRFDREKSAAGSEGWLRRGFISGLSLMQWDERDRLRWDYSAISDTMRRYTSIDDIHEFYRRMVFNILVRNTDDHPRNHGFLSGNHGIALSPAYDIVPSPAHPGVGTDFRLAMAMGKNGREANLANALSRVERFGLLQKEAQGIMNQLRETVAAWRYVFEECGVTGREIELLAPSLDREMIME
jgi:serine/threonine-protein kinase HipA